MAEQNNSLAVKFREFVLSLSLALSPYGHLLIGFIICIGFLIWIEWTFVAGVLVVLFFVYSVYTHYDKPQKMLTEGFLERTQANIFGSNGVTYVYRQGDPLLHPEITTKEIAEMKKNVAKELKAGIEGEIQ